MIKSWLLDLAVNALDEDEQVEDEAARVPRRQLGGDGEEDREVDAEEGDDDGPR